MNQDIFQGKWKQIRGETKRMWGKITDDELDQMNGNADKLAGILQERYGYSRERSEQEVTRFREEMNRKYGSQGSQS